MLWCFKFKLQTIVNCALIHSTLHSFGFSALKRLNFQMIPLLLYHIEFWPSKKNSLPQIFLPKGFFANKRLSKKGSLPNNVSPNSHLHPRNLPLIKPNRLLDNSFWYFKTKIQFILKSLKSYSENSILWQSLPLLELHGIAFGSWNAWFVRQCSSFLHLASGVKSRQIPAKNKNM